MNSNNKLIILYSGSKALMTFIALSYVKLYTDDNKTVFAEILVQIPVWGSHCWINYDGWQLAIIIIGTQRYTFKMDRTSYSVTLIAFQPQPKWFNSGMSSSYVLYWDYRLKMSWFNSMPTLSFQHNIIFNNIIFNNIHNIYSTKFTI